MFKKLYIYILASMFIFTGCEDLLDVDSNTLITDGSHLDSESDMQANVLGIASLMQNVSYKIVLLNDLRSDILMTTENASDELKQINNHVITSDNEFATPIEFYNIVENCNDFLNNVGEYDANKYSMDSTMFKRHIADVIKIRVWSYFQIAKIYNKVLYTKTSYELVSDVENSKPVEYNLDAILPMLIAEMNEIEVKDNFNWASINEAYENFSSYFLNYDMILGDLYLWNGEYQAAADLFNGLINSNIGGRQYIIKKDVLKADKYKDIFIKSFKDIKSEIISSTEFKEVNNQPFILQKWFGTKTSEYYMLAPTQQSAVMFNSESSTDAKNIGDQHRREASMKLNTNSVDWIVKKYEEYKYRFPFYRAAELHLKYAEALAHLGRVDVAMALLNEGLEEYWDGVNSEFKPELGIPFNPFVRFCGGIRYRVSLKPVELFTTDEIAAGIGTTAADSLQRFEQALISESARELAFEGKRFETLIRFARRNNDPKILADPISLGYDELGMKDEINTKLMDPTNWYVKY